MKTIILRIILRIFRILQINRKKVILTSYNGRRFSCNPKYIALALLKTDAKIYFALRENHNAELPDGIIGVKYRSFWHFYHLMTAKYIVVNSTGLAELLPYRSNQVLINTWHGGGYFKTIGNDHFISDKQRNNRVISGKNTSYIFASCEKFAEQLPHSMCVEPEKVYRAGLPRNDIFFRKHDAVVEKIHKLFQIDKWKCIVLYAPTYRDGDKKTVNESGFSPIDVEAILNTLKARFNKEYVFMFKAHHNMLPHNLSEQCINASNYDDIQELMLAADVLITDYSSCMWDFCLSHKAGFLYTPDIEQYSHNHAFGTEPDIWPYVICTSNEALIERIMTFDQQKNDEKIDKYLEYMGSFEDGHAVNKILHEIFTEIKSI